MAREQWRHRDITDYVNMRMAAATSRFMLLRHTPLLARMILCMPFRFALPPPCRHVAILPLLATLPRHADATTRRLLFRRRIDAARLRRAADTATRALRCYTRWLA